jgi:hypothetical protein
LLAAHIDKNVSVYQHAAWHNGVVEVWSKYYVQDAKHVVDDGECNEQAKKEQNLATVCPWSSDRISSFIHNITVAQRVGGWLCAA